MKFNDRAEAGMFFLGFFLGTASKVGAYGIYDDEWRRLVATACDCADMGKFSWLEEEKANDV